MMFNSVEKLAVLDNRLTATSTDIHRSWLETGIKNDQ